MRSASENTLGWAAICGFKPAQPIEIALGAGELGAAECRARARPDARAVERGALPAHREEHFVGHRRVDARQAAGGRPRPAPPRWSSRRGRRYRRGCRRSDRRSRQAAWRGRAGCPRSPPTASRRPAPARSSRARRKSLTAMSASLTGELSSPLVQCLNGRARGRARELAGLAHDPLRAGRASARLHWPATVRPSSRSVGALVP